MAALAPASSVRSGGPLRVNWRVVGVVAACVALILGALAWHSSVPTDPLAHTYGPAASITVKPGQTITVVFPLGTRSTERPTIISASGTSTRRARVTAVYGLANGIGYGSDATPTAAAAAEHTHLVPLSGLRFTTAPSTSQRAWLATHVFMAVTVTVTGRGCIDIPPLRMRYTVGGATFDRLVPVPTRISTPGVDGVRCLTGT